MANIFTASFSEIVELTYGTSAKNAVCRALNLEYSFDDMVRLLALYRRESDPFLDVDEFVKKGAELGLKTVMDELRTLSEEK